MKSSSALSLTSLQILKFNPAKICSVTFPMPGILRTGNFSKNSNISGTYLGTTNNPFGLFTSDANFATILLGPTPQLAVSLVAKKISFLIFSHKTPGSSYFSIQ